MNTYLDDLATFEATDINDDKITVNIFDFDGTLFDSPNPNPKLWDNKVIGRLRGDIKQGGYGWYQNTLTMDDEYIDPNNFIQSTVAEVEKSIKNSNAVTVMLTGRNTDYEGQVRKIINQGGLEFDEYGFKSGGRTTMQFKQDFINDLIEKYGPERVVMWDDRIKHVHRFKEFLDSIGMENQVHFVDNPDYHMSPELEKDLVDKLMKDPRVGQKKRPKKFGAEKKQKKPIFWAAYLYPEENSELLSRLGSEIPEGWKTFAHHMTLAFGKIKSEEVQKFISQNMGKDVELTAVELGKSNDAMAVKIQSNVPSQNDLTHITVAVPPDGKPVKSNFITNWERLPEPIKLRAKIGAEYN